MDISIFGMGYVGAVCSACLSNNGHNIIGVDVSQEKVDLINSGASPIVEPGLAEMISKGIKNGNLSATTNSIKAVENTSVTMVCVGTPSMANGNLELNYIKAVCHDIGLALKGKNEPHYVVIRSTVLPGTVKDIVIPALEKASGRVAGRDFFVATNPEFLRESTAIFDFYNPPMTVIGQMDDETGQLIATLYQELDAEIICQPIEVAEMIKYTCNVWHAAKITFANEIGNISRGLGIDGRDVMKVVCKDKKLNISNYYMRPGFAYGGSCLPKDVKALTFKALSLDIKTPMLSQLMASNQNQIQNAINIVKSLKHRKITLLGLSFKSETDDLRESPFVELAEQLIGKGFDLKIYDKYIDYARVHGANKEYINCHIPHVSSLLVSDLQAAIDHGEIIVIANGDKSFKGVLENLSQEKKIVDLHGFMTHASDENKQGICW
ncbi:UDP-glucose/GDP-mannose dehydrogenase family protein [Parashewanella spongiae]|uniref:UDP-glucose 6-dehydrogenase n=1 Tax=Parashewanella spongiae TaxID=342950 RepID=A0A3A6TRE2_9GAMM|nr:UDP-glucose/GDP-mannose dehydrogenase family protein [Parashewanella spongiae]MCL1079031.1 UDP-glucose/GDP-mannose dehydrogenase family protein [Parashewanella spongiae]RJY10964.1 UDP-glucose/GDP-mannose dehydrogenase family protein [Parashewanella spongiae]